MDQEYWQSRWRDNKIAFHENQPNEQLINHLSYLRLNSDETVFVPLCGKSIDLDWLNSEGYYVVGVELNDSAVKEVFERRNVTPEVRPLLKHMHYHSDKIDIYVGDIFTLTPEIIGSIDAVYDRGAMVSLPEKLRKTYSEQIYTLTGAVGQLLISYNYPQSQTEGPPFSIPAKEIESIYGNHFKQHMLAKRAITGPLAERCEGWEQAWHLEPR